MALTQIFEIDKVNHGKFTPHGESNLGPEVLLRGSYIVVTGPFAHYFNLYLRSYLYFSICMKCFFSIVFFLRDLFQNTFSSPDEKLIDFSLAACGGSCLSLL
jgi:hypothetical protein